MDSGGGKNMLDILDGYPVNHKHVVEGVYLEINVFYAFDAMVGNRCIFNGNGQIIAGRRRIIWNISVSSSTWKILEYLYFAFLVRVVRTLEDGLKPASLSNSLMPLKWMAVSSMSDFVT